VVPKQSNDLRKHFTYLELSEGNVEREYCETDYDIEAGELTVFYVNEHRFQKCPHVKFHIGGHPVIAVVDSGSEATILAQEVYDRLAGSDTKLLQIPIT
jgi:hypothetical protein